MTSVKLKFRPSTQEGQEGSLFFQIIHERRVRQLLTKHRIQSSEWDDKYMRIIVGTESDRALYLRFTRERIMRETERINRIVKHFEARGLPFSADDIVDEFRIYSKEHTLARYTERLIDGFREEQRFRTAETYRAAINSFFKFLSERKGIWDTDIMMDCIDPQVIEAYERWLRGRGIRSNTVSFYLRILRAIYNRAVGEGITVDRRPFLRSYTGIDRTVKRALPLSSLRKIRALDLSLSPGLDYARDMFLLSFMLRGMSFVDMAYLRKSDLKEGYVIYRRRKTGQMLTIKWTKEMKTITDKYPGNDTPYLLPILRKAGQGERSCYRNAAYNINRKLKAIASMAGVTIPLTLYVARHSWASVAKSKGIPISVISEGMGHESELTTRIYLASLDCSIIDRANSVIISSL